MLPVPRSFYVIAVLGLLLIWATHVISVQQTQLDAKPLVEDFKSDQRTEDVRRGPVKVSRTTTTTPDGGKVVVQTREIAAEERHLEVKDESSHKETAAPIARRTRYLGAGVNPLALADEIRLRAGMTVLGAVDLGVAIDISPAARKASRPMVELTYRF